MTPTPDRYYCLVCGRMLPPQRPPYPPTCLTHAKRTWIHPGWFRRIELAQPPERMAA